MEHWYLSAGKDHGFFFAKLNVENVIVLDTFGGAQEVPLVDYYAANPISREDH